MRHLLRPAAAVAAGLLLTTTLASPADAARVDRGAAWLERQLTDGLVHNTQFGGFDDYGLTADVALALDAIGGHRATEREVRDALAPHVDSWTTGVDFGSSDVYAGSVAKAVVLAQVTAGDPRDFGGVDLVRRLNARVSDAAGQVGRIEDRTAGTDFANVIGQAFAARGLARAGSAKADEVRRFLLRQQCSQGYFRLNFADKAAEDQSCDGGTRATSAPDTDATALALLSLMALPTKPRAVRRAIDNGTDWLVSRQKRNGSFGGGTSTEASNSNSTGLAAWALGEHGACRAAVEAARWVKGLQVSGDVSGTPLAGERGAIAYNSAALTEAEQNGIGEAERDQWRRATSQAAPALSFLTLKQCREG